jgi:predicted Na+-dependent transporter
LKLVKENLLLLSISLGIVLAWFFPVPGKILKGWGMSNPLILLIFFCQGLDLEAKEIQKGAQLLKALCWGFVISQILGPVLGYLMVQAQNWRAANQIGFILMCCMAPTLVSGAVLANRAGGDSATALILAVGINLLAILTIPINLNWSLGALVRLDAAGLFLKLIFLVLVPAVVGQVVRRQKPDWAEKEQRLRRNGPIIALGIIVYLSCSSQVDRLRDLTLGYLGSLLLPSVTVHLILLVIGYIGARYLLRIQEPACRSLAIVCSQKTLPIAIAVWSIAFAEVYPLAVIPALIFHPSQILCDGILATIWAKRRE